MNAEEAEKKGEEQGPDAAAPGKPVRIPPGLVVAALGLALYVNTFGHGYVLDDNPVITQNPLTQRGVEGIPTILTSPYRHGYWTGLDVLYRPLSVVMFAVEWELFPNRPAASHVVNVLLYALLGLILFRVLRKLLGGYGVVLPFVASLLFIAHPVHTEVVANIKSRDEILCLLFLLLTLDRLWTHLESRSVTALITALFCLFLALLSKENAVVFIAVLPVAILFFSDAGAGRTLRLTALCAVPVAVYIGVRLAVLGCLTAPPPENVLTNSLVAAPDQLSRTTTAFLILGRYLLLLFIPHPLVCDYSYNQIPIAGLGDFRVILSLLAYAGMGVLAVVWFRRKSVVAFGILFFLIMMSVYSNLFFLIGSQMAERFLFTPSLGFCLVAAFVLDRFQKREGGPEREPAGLLEMLRARPVLFSVVGVVLAACAVKTVVRNVDWRSEYALYSADIRKSSRSALLHYLYGQTLMRTRGLREADPRRRRKYLELAVQEYAVAVSIHERYSHAHGLMGLSYAELGYHDKAIECYEAAIRYDPGCIAAYNNLGGIYHHVKRDYEKALQYYLKAVEIDPAYSLAHANLGETYMMLSRWGEAIEAFLKCLKHEPYNAHVHQLIGMAYQNRGDMVSANRHFEQARALQSSGSH